MPDTSDETGGIAPEETPGAGGSAIPGPGSEAATEAMNTATTGPAETPPMSGGAYGQYGYGTTHGQPAPPPMPASGLRKHWPWIVGAIAAGFVLLLGGAALGATLDQAGDWIGDNDRGYMNGNGMMRGDDSDFPGRGGMMDRDGDGDGYGPGSGSGGQYGCPGDPDDCPQTGDGGEYGPGYGRPDGSDPSLQAPCPRATPGQSTAPQSF